MKRWSCSGLTVALAVMGCGTPRQHVDSTQPRARAPAVSTPAPAPAPLDVDAAFKAFASDICKKLLAKSRSEGKRRLAIYYFFVPPDHARNQMGEYVASVLPCFIEDAAKDEISIFTRRHLCHLLKEQGKQMSALYDENEQVELGKLIGARYIVCGDVHVLDKRWDVVAVVLDVQTGEALAHVRGKLPRLKKLEEIARGPLIDRVDKEAPADKDAQGSPAAKIIERGDHFYDQRRDDKALDEYQNALKVDPDFPRVLFRLGYLYQELKKDPKTALSFYDRYIRLDPKKDSNYHKAFNNRGVIRMDKGDAGAMDDFDKAIAAKPKYAAAYANRAKCRTVLLKKDLDKAVADLKKAIELEPKTASHHYNLGVLQSQLQRYDEAVQALGAAIALNPKDKLAYCARAGIYAGPANKPTLAEKDLTQALKIDPKYVDALYNRGIVRCYKLNQKDAGVADLKKCLELDTAGKYSEAARQALDAIK